MDSEEIDKLLFRYYKIKEKIKDYQEYLEDVKIKIEDIFEEYDTDHIKSDNFEAFQKTVAAKRICKSDLPSDIYERYARETTFTTFQVTKRGEKATRRSRSRNRKSRK